MDRITPVKHANEGYLSKEIKAYTRHCSRVQPDLVVSTRNTAVQRVCLEASSRSRASRGWLGGQRWKQTKSRSQLGGHPGGYGQNCPGVARNLKVNMVQSVRARRIKNENVNNNLNLYFEISTCKNVSFHFFAISCLVVVVVKYSFPVLFY